MRGDGPVAAVILAAGMSRRFGTPKLLVEVNGRTLLEHAIAAAREAGLAPLIVVAPVWLRLPEAVPPGVRWVRNPFPERGMSLSLRLGIAAIPEAVTAAVILLGDQPGMPVSTIVAVRGARGERAVVAAEADGVIAPPVLIERSHFQLFDTLAADAGLRSWLAANPGQVRAVAVGSHAPDIDTPADLDGVLDP